MQNYENKTNEKCCTRQKAYLELFFFFGGGGGGGGMLRVNLNHYIFACAVFIISVP